MPDKPLHEQLSRRAQLIWRAVLKEYTLDEVGRELLLRALQAADRVEEARRILAKEGLIVPDRYGSPKPHPATLIERDARAHELRCWAELGLEPQGRK